MSQDGLGLIIRRMRDGHAVQSSRSRNRRKKLIAQSPRGIFEIQTVAARLTGHVGAVADKFDAEGPRKLFDETFVFIRFRSAKLMVKMQDENSDPEFRSQFGKQVKQSHRIRSARNTHTNAISRPNHRMPADGFKYEF